MKRFSLLLTGVALGCLGMITPLQGQTYDSMQQDTLRQRGTYRDTSDVRDTSMYNDTYQRRNSTFDQDSVRQRGTFDRDTIGTESDTKTDRDATGRYGTEDKTGTQWKSGSDTSWRSGSTGTQGGSSGTQRKNTDTTYRSGSTGGYQSGTQGGYHGGTQSGSQWKSDSTRHRESGSTGTGWQRDQQKSGSSSDTWRQGGAMMSQLGNPTYSGTDAGFDVKVWLVSVDKMQGVMRGGGEYKEGSKTGTTGRSGRDTTTMGMGREHSTTGMEQSTQSGYGATGSNTSGEPGQYHVIMKIRDEDRDRDVTSGTATLKVKSPSDKTQTVKLKKMKDHFGGNVRLNEVGTYSFTSKVKSGGKTSESTFEFTTER